MYCGNGLGADPMIDALRAWSGGSAYRPPVLRPAPQRIGKLCTSRGITYYFASQAEADAFQCPPALTPPAGGPSAPPAGPGGPSNPPAGPSAPPVAGGPGPGDVIDYGNPSTYPGPNIPPPSPGTANQINSIPSDDSAPPVMQAGMMPPVSPLVLGALALGAFFLLRSRR